MNQNCDFCGKSFHAERVTARFCSTKCRVKFNRQQKREQKTVEPAASKDELALLLEQSDKIAHSLAVSLVELKVNRSNRLLERIAQLGDENREVIRKIANLVAN